jgi:uncharacterized protein YggE
MRNIFQLFFCILVFSVIEQPAYAQQISDDMRAVTVNGEGVIKAEPDKAEINVTIYTEAKELPDAKRQNDQKLQRFRSIARSLNIGSSQLHTINTSVQPQYSYTPNKAERQRTLTGYTVSHTVEVTLKQLDVLGEFLQKLVEADIDRIDNIRYGVTKEDELKEHALVKALSQARRKAKLLADSLDESLGKVLSINEGNMQYQPPVVPFRTRTAMAMAKSADAVAPPRGDLEIRSTVNASFALTN